MRPLMLLSAFVFDFSKWALRGKYMGPDGFSARSAIFCRYWTCSFSGRNNQAIGPRLSAIFSYLQCQIRKFVINHDQSGSKGVFSSSLSPVAGMTTPMFRTRASISAASSGVSRSIWIVAERPCANGLPS